MRKAPIQDERCRRSRDADHYPVRKWFPQSGKLSEAKAPAEERKALADRICKELTVHADIEEQIVYPAAREVIGDDALLNEAEAEVEVEHASAKDLMAQISDILVMDADEALFGAKVIVRGEYIGQRRGVRLRRRHGDPVSRGLS